MTELQRFTSPIICEISNDGKSYTLEKGFYYYRATRCPAEKQSGSSVSEFLGLCGENHARLDNENLPQSDFHKLPEKSPRYNAITVPKGFKSDGFTNFGFDFIVPRFGKGLKCAILHDYLCEGFHSGLNTRKFADEVFLEAMLETRAFCKFKAYLLFFAVRFFAKIKGYK